ncbi:MAG: hypothetical protein Q8N63_02365 [Nanoarchaeota archaeon]|nr:hypothetical protein [Nanoarchaeota archaeon]
MALNISGINFFMPVFSFLFVFILVYALLAKTKIIGDSKFVLLLISFIIAVVFMSFSSLELFVRTIIPWFIVLVVAVFLILIIGMFSSKSWVPKSGFAWVVIVVLLVIFLISAIYVFNPVFHPDLGVASGEGTSLLQQIKGYMNGGVVGSIILVVIAAIVAWVITKK